MALHQEGLFKSIPSPIPTVYDSVEVARGHIIYISNKFPGVADAALLVQRPHRESLSKALFYSWQTRKIATVVWMVHPLHTPRISQERLLTLSPSSEAPSQTTPVSPSHTAFLDVLIICCLMVPLKQFQRSQLWPSLLHGHLWFMIKCLWTTPHLAHPRLWGLMLAQAFGVHKMICPFIA